MTQFSGADMVGADLLQEAFRSFGEATTALESSYRTLKARVEQLDVELADRNQALGEALAQSEHMRRYIDTVVASLSTGILVADTQGQIERCNQAAMTMLGLTADQIVGQTLDVFLHEQGLAGEQYPLKSSTGTLLSLSRMAPGGEDECGIGSIVLLHDISDVHRLEERLHRRDRLASMGEMVGRIAHEVRNPLGSVELFASMLRQDLAHDPTLHGYAEHISMAVQSMDRLLSNLLTYTRPSHPQRAWFATETLVREAMTLAAHALTRQQIVVDLQLEQAPPNMWCDGPQIRQVLLNLILNAVDAMEVGGRLTITVSDYLRSSHESPVAKIVVQDNGRGIDAEHLSRVFDPFFTTRDEGTGLGLAIVHALVDGHDGRIEIDSQIGKGTSVTVIIPQETNPLHARARRQRLSWERGPMKEDA
ncbi:MAG: ATP-binding protein [Nitrospiraceae bacterium]